MEDIFTLEHLTSLVLLIMLQAVLGLDNLLYISIASKQAPEKDQARVRTIGIAWAIVLRIVLLFLLLQLIQWFQNPWLIIAENPYFVNYYKERAAFYENMGNSILADLDKKQIELLESKQLTTILVVGYNSTRKSLSAE